jgi:hypothetical protein
MSKEKNMSKLYMLCGLPGSGKTTLARKLEAELPALRISPDDLLEPIFGARDYIHQWENYNKQRTKMEALLLDIALRSVELGINAILENGFWSREERDMYRAKAAQRGVSVKLYYLDVPRDELRSRLRKRNENLPPGTFHITESQLEEWSGLFQPPTADELG